MIDLRNIFNFAFSGKKADIINVKKSDNRIAPLYGDRLLCARYYNLDETQYVDLYVPYEGPLGIWMSGGADSSLLAFLLAKTIKDYNMEVKILPMSFKRDNKPWNLAVATNVVQQIENILEIKSGDIFLSHNYCYFGNHEAADFGELTLKHVNNLKRNKLVTIIYNGLTKNPDPLPPELTDEREIIRDNPNEGFDDSMSINDIEHRLVSTPFLFQTKEIVAELYKKHNLIETLLPYTRSCEGLIKSTEFFRKPCYTCWWCRERKWAFSKYSDDPLRHIPPSDRLKKMCTIV